MKVEGTETEVLLALDMFMHFYETVSGDDNSGEVFFSKSWGGTKPDLFVKFNKPKVKNED